MPIQAIHGKLTYVGSGEADSAREIGKQHFWVIETMKFDLPNESLVLENISVHPLAMPELNAFAGECFVVGRGGGRCLLGAICIDGRVNNYGPRYSKESLKGFVVVGVSLAVLVPWILVALFILVDGLLSGEVLIGLVLGGAMLGAGIKYLLPALQALKFVRAAREVSRLTDDDIRRLCDCQR